MKTLRDILSKTNYVESGSQKVQALITNASTTDQLMLPKQRYEPFFMKVLSDFKKFHNIPDNIPPPQGNMMIHKLLSYILDVMAFSMGQEKRNALLVELNDYKEGLPFDLRWILG